MGGEVQNPDHAAILVVGQGIRSTNSILHASIPALCNYFINPLPMAVTLKSGRLYVNIVMIACRVQNIMLLQKQNRLVFYI